MLISKLRINRMPNTRVPRVGDLFVESVEKVDEQYLVGDASKNDLGECSTIDNRVTGRG